MITENIINVLLILLIIIIIIYLCGNSFIHLIDSRVVKMNVNMENFSINDNNSMQKININPMDNQVHNNPIQKNQEQNNELANHQVQKNQLQNNQLKKNQLITFDEDYYKQMKKDSMVEGFSNEPDKSFKGWEFQPRKTQTCIKNHTHKKDGNNMNCTYGLTNYADPKDMTPMDLNIFRLNYPENMTLQDYINWLYCFVQKENELPYNHLKNLEKLKSGKELVEEHGILPPPSYNYPPLNSEDYFNKMYTEANEYNIAPPLNSNTASMIGYNYDQYSEFSQNTDLYGSTGKITNTDIALKKDTKKLYNFINPVDSNNINIDNQYESYRLKKVEV
jgi:hypothetical protein